MYPCMDMWGSEEGLNHFLPLRQNPTLPFYLDWLASELRGSACLCPTMLRFQAQTPCRVFMWVSGIQAWFLCLCKNQSYPVRHLPTLHSSFKYIEKEMTLQKTLQSLWQRQTQFHPPSCEDPATEVTSRSEAALPPTALPSLMCCRQTGQENGTWGRVRLSHS